MAMTTSKTVYRAGHSPLPAGVFVAPFPRSLGDGSLDDRIDAVPRSASSPAARPRRHRRETAAVILEPVLGEGGYVPAPARFLEGIALDLR